MLNTCIFTTSASILIFFKFNCIFTVKIPTKLTVNLIMHHMETWKSQILKSFQNMKITISWKGSYIINIVQLFYFNRREFAQLEYYLVICVIIFCIVDILFDKEWGTNVSSSSEYIEYNIHTYGYCV